MQKDHRPYFLKRALSKFQRFYARHFLRPHFASLGKAPTIVKPWYVEVFGTPIDIGDYVSIIAASDNRVRLSVWADKQVSGRIRIGDYALLCPGARISSASAIHIGDNIHFTYFTTEHTDLHAIARRSGEAGGAHREIQKLNLSADYAKQKILFIHRLRRLPQIKL